MITQYGKTRLLKYQLDIFFITSDLDIQSKFKIWSTKISKLI